MKSGKGIAIILIYILAAIFLFSIVSSCKVDLLGEIDKAIVEANVVLYLSGRLYSER